MHRIVPPPFTRYAVLLVGLLTLAACSRYAPVEARFEASPARITAGETTTLSWGLVSQPVGPLPRPGTVSYVLLLEPGALDVTDQTSLVVSPEATTTYELLARWGDQEVRVEATVVVDGVADEPDPETNEAPTATDGSFVTEPGEALAVDLATLASDPDGDALTFEVVAGAAFGTTDVVGSTLTYTPAADAERADAVTVAASDGQSSTEFEVSFTVEGFISDLEGDHTFAEDLDALGLRWYRDGDDVVFEIELTTEERVLGYMNIDIDRDPDTGTVGGVALYCEAAPASGYELQVDLFLDEVFDLTEGGSSLGAVAPVIVGTLTTIRFPLAWVGDDVVLAPYLIVGEMDPSDCVPGAGGAYLEGPA